MALNGTAIPRKLDETLENMLHALCLLRRAGAPARFGDDDGGRLFDGQRNRAEHLLDRLATGAVLFGRGDFKFLAGGFVRKLCWLLGLNGIIRWPDGCRAFAGSHEGYCRLPQAVIHRRWVFSLKSHFWLVRDLAEGAGQHQIHLFWHTSPEPVQRKDAVRVFEFSDQQSGITLLTTAEPGWTQEVLQRSWSAAYGCKQPCTVVHFGVVATLPGEVVTLLLPVRGAAFHPGEVVRIDDGTNRASVRGYRYKTPDEDHCIFFAEAGKSWSLRAWASDAEFVCVSRKPVGQRKLIFCNGSYVEIGGRRVVSCTQVVTRCEMDETNGQTEVFSSNSKLVAQHLSVGIECGEHYDNRFSY